MELVRGGELFDLIVRNKSLNEMEASPRTQSSSCFGGQKTNQKPLKTKGLDVLEAKLAAFFFGGGKNVVAKGKKDWLNI